jgi:catechol 2,3-dioxygenase-like lactoylglutathione lyase family enzyme
MEERTRTHIADVGTVAIPVSDQDKALAFYVGKLGFEKRRDATFGGSNRWIEVAAPGAATTIALVRPSPGTRAGIDTGIRLVTEDTEADYADLRARGVDADPILHVGGVPPMFSFRDDDGNSLYIVQRG